MSQPILSSARAFTPSPAFLSPTAPSTLTPSTSAPSMSAVPDPAPTHETVRHMVCGSLAAVQMTILILHKYGYAEPNDWSRPMPTRRPNEVMVILTKKVRVG